jgi:hypothetical protein
MIVLQDVNQAFARDRQFEPGADRPSHNSLAFTPRVEM